MGWQLSSSVMPGRALKAWDASARLFRTSVSRLVYACSQELVVDCRFPQLHYSAYSDQVICDLFGELAKSWGIEGISRLYFLVHLGIAFEVKRYWDRTLTHPEDLPAQWDATCSSDNPAAPIKIVESKLTSAPSVMTDFRKVILFVGISPRIKSLFTN